MPSISPTKKYYSEDTNKAPPTIDNKTNESSDQPSFTQLFVEADDDYDGDYSDEGGAGDVGETIPDSETKSNNFPVPLTLGTIIACTIVLVVFIMAAIYMSRNNRNNSPSTSITGATPNGLPESSGLNNNNNSNDRHGYSTNQFPIYDTTFDDQPSTSSITFSHQSELPSNMDTFSFDAMSLTSSLPSSRHTYPRDQNVYPDDLVYDPKDDTLYGSLGIEG
eukprot:CAMPEP_0116012546 /NCGR_PEP_ID=MMETSP0321-20121206/5187_1 /TAXON_ID=163516 /ORGANISM="Leptocylindrus danicus var. danicus, Strain B650" /LENGTH=220 /DNA_ID=CAMNT_0003481909 /DNA_START=977 /DNA_END=1639 /DNA_ORIENTATION=-